MDPAVRAIFELSDLEKLQLVQDLWDDLASRPDSIPIYDWQVEELERRNAQYERDPGSALSWDEVKRSIRAKYGR